MSDFSRYSFFGLPEDSAEEADVLLLPLPYEGTVCYGKGTSRGPAAIWEASTHPELWDEEIEFTLDSRSFHSAAPVLPADREDPGAYLDRVRGAAGALHAHSGLVLSIGGEHSLTPPLVFAAVSDADDLSDLTIVQFDAHADLRSEYEGTPHSHACAMRHLVDRGANLLAIGIRSAEGNEAAYGLATGRVHTFHAWELSGGYGGGEPAPNREGELLERLESLDGDFYLTFDVDGLEPALCPGTGTPVPGGLGWWQAMSYLRALLLENRTASLIGCDIVETVPQPHTQVNEYTAARLAAKMIAYHFKGR
jgi:agmatinase